MAQDNLIKMAHQQKDEKTGKKYNTHVYYTYKNKRKLAKNKLKMNKYNPVLRKHVEYVETKK